MNAQTLVLATLITGIIGLAYTFWRSAWISKKEVGTEKMAAIAAHISDGAMAFLKAEYKVLIIFVIAVAVARGAAARQECREGSHQQGENQWMCGASEHGDSPAVRQ